ncbi:gluconokinase [Chamaesiphon sp. GL140_3_metabinner_50]|uniref:gluconokinase n=1 Tax=Chamaesiphon sp. GL140_3_metabinner_50 TaxID=2970812 RepID=UPI0025F09330|nr:gluconokinase [Chamaesiphon sp. GL140_3_metabinner_50]
MTQQQIPPKIIVLMGVSGCGKTTIAQTLATKHHWHWFDADDFHSPASKAKIERDEPLTDADRLPWLQTLQIQIQQWLQADRPTVLACSALKRNYRDLLSGGNPAVKFVYLKGSYELISQRLIDRQGHFAKVELLKSQFDTIEEPSPDEAIEIDIDRAKDEIVRSIDTALLINN